MNIFKEKINIIRPASSKFDLSHENKLTLDMGKLVPILAQEIMPGDKWRVHSELLLRFAPMLAPLYHRVEITTHFFYVPNRILWNEWENFIGGGPQGNLAPLHPTITLDTSAYSKGSLGDYLGIPTPTSGPGTISPVVNSLPFRAYQKIYNDYYRDQNLITEIPNQLGSGNVTPLDGQPYTDLITLRTRAWEKDYFTTAATRAQRGNPVGAPVDYPTGGTSQLKNVISDAPLISQTALNTDVGGFLSSTPGAVGARLETEANVMIAEIRKANVLQEWLEKTQRSGARLKELILQHFGISNSDGRLQRPEYLGGAVNPVVISEVLSTFDNSAADLPQGQMTGHGISVGNNNGFNRTFEEHGWVIGIMSVLPRTNYYQGIQRQWFKTDKFSYPWPSFAHLGEQEVLNKEVYFDHAAIPPIPNDGTFGYQSRYAEYKFINSSIHGDFRDSLQYWHMARKFTSTPVLNQSFVEADPTKDIFAVVDPNVHSLYCQIYHNISAIRPLPYNPNPKL